MYPRRTRLPHCYDDPKPNDLAKTMLGLFATYEAFAVCKMVRTAGCADELWKIICEEMGK